MDDAQDPDTGQGQHLSAGAGNTAGARAATAPRWRWSVLIAAAFLAICAGGAVWYGASWWMASDDESVQYATQRDDALRVGQYGMVNFSSLDYRNVDQGLDVWERTSTGPLHEEIVKGRQANAERIKQAKTVTNAKVLDSAVTELDPRAGKARVIAALEITVTPEGKQPSVKRNRFQAELTREGGQWKVSGLGPVPVGPPAGDKPAGSQ